MSTIRRVAGRDANDATVDLRTDYFGRLKQSHGQPDPVTGVLNNVTAGQAGNTVVLAFDGFSSVSFYTSGTFAGCTVVMEQSPDSTDGISGTWYSLLAVRGDSNGTMSTNLLASATNTNVAFNAYAPGATFVRARMTARTSGDVSVRLVASTASTTPAVGVGGAISTSTGLEPYVASRLETGTLLAANATYTGPTRDIGSDLTRQSSRVRLLVRHTAGLTPGTIQVQQSQDNATWTETTRFPVPSDGYPHDFEAPLFMRYYRVLFTNGAVVQTVFNVWSENVVAEGNVSDKRILPFTFSTSALGANGVFTGPTLDLGLNHDWDEFRVHSHSDQVGAASGLIIYQSRDASNWRGVVSGSPLANTALMLACPIYMRYLRVIYTNGTNAQGYFDLNAALSPK